MTVFEKDWKCVAVVLTNSKSIPFEPIELASSACAQIETLGILLILVLKVSSLDMLRTVADHENQCTLLAHNSDLDAFEFWSMYFPRSVCDYQFTPQSS